MNNPRDNQKLPLRAPSARVTAALAAGMLAVGVAVGAAIGPAPSPSQANPSLPLLLQTLSRGAAARAQQGAPAAVGPTAGSAATSATTRRRKRRHRAKHASEEEASSATTSTPAAEAVSETTKPATASTPTGAPKASALAPVTHVWLIELSGASFEKASATPAAAPYIDTQAVPAGTLLSGWSALDGGAFADEAALLGGGGPQLLDTIVQPPCPEGTAGASCAPETPGALSAADEFLKTTVPTLTSSAAFRESGLIVVTFASVANAQATGLPAGATTATLTAQPPAGVLLISPFASVGAHSSVTFDPTSPKQSVEKLLRR